MNNALMLEKVIKPALKKSNVDIADKYPQWEQGTGFKYKLKVNKKVHRDEWREGEPTLHYERTTAVTVDLNDSDKQLNLTLGQNVSRRPLAITLVRS